MAEATFAPALKTGPICSPEAEKACLGALILDTDGFSKIEGSLSERDFYEELHCRIFRAMVRLFSLGRSLDLVTLHNEISGDALYQDAGGEAYLTDLVERVGSQAHLSDYARIIKEKAIYRELIRAAAEITEECYREGNRRDQFRPAGGANEMLERAEAKIFRLAHEKGESGLSPVSTIVHPLMEDLEAVRQHKMLVTGLATGFGKFDELCSGLHKEEFIIVAGRPGQGKTAFALNLAAHVGLVQKKPVAIFSLEMDKRSLLLRMLCAEVMADATKLRRGYLERAKYQDIINAANRFLSADIFIDDNKGVTTLEVRSRARRLASELRSKNKELALLIIDYLQLLKYGERSESRQVEVAEISRSLKILAQDLHVPIVALSQLSRRTEEKDRSGRPQLADLRESGSLEQDADVVAMIYRPGLYKQNASPEERAQAEIIIAKQRNGPLGMIPMYFLDQCTRFVERGDHEGAASIEEVETVE